MSFAVWIMVVFLDIEEGNFPKKEREKACLKKIRQAFFSFLPHIFRGIPVLWFYVAAFFWRKENFSRDCDVGILMIPASIFKLKIELTIGRDYFPSELINKTWHASNVPKVPKAIILLALNIFPTEDFEQFFHCFSFVKIFDWKLYFEKSFN